jgi:integrase
MMLCVLAYGGLRPASEAHPLTVDAVGDRSLFVRASGKKGAQDRHVEIVKPLAADLTEWLGVLGRSTGPLLPFEPGGHVGGHGAMFTKDQWRRWTRHVFRPAAKAAGIEDESVIPRDLRGSYVTLLIYEGRNAVEIAQQLGHSPTMTLNTYARLFANFDRKNQVRASTAIQRARAEVNGGLRLLG